MICSCANPDDCIANGCALLRKTTQTNQISDYPPYIPRISPDHGGCQPLKHLTEQDVRRIIREEVADILRKNGKD